MKQCTACDFKCHDEEQRCPACKLVGKPGVLEFTNDYHTYTCDCCGFRSGVTNRYGRCLRCGGETKGSDPKGTNE